MITGTIKKEIPGFENYEISEKGVIYILNRYIPEYGHIETIKPRIDRGGYWSLRLHKDVQPRTFFLHRLLAECFISNPKNLPFVNHKNGIKTDNTLSNLEWVSHRQNVIDAYQKGLNSSAKKIVHTTSGTVYASITVAAKAIGLNYNTVCKRLKRNDPTLPLQYLR